MKTRILSLLAIAALAVAACGGPSATPAPSGVPASPTFSAVPSEALTPAPHTTAAPTDSPKPTAAPSPTLGFSNLDSLDSYRFTWVGSSPAPANTSWDGSGTVINGPDKTARFTYTFRAAGVFRRAEHYFIAGSQAWFSDDGAAWRATARSAADAIKTISEEVLGGASLTDFVAVGTQTKNGIACIRYEFGTSDLWFAASGGYPVSGIYTLTGSSSFSFDITNVNDASNKVSPPAGLVATPT